MTEFSFTYKPGSTSTGNDDPSVQFIGFGYMDFTPVPEARTADTLSSILLFVIGAHEYRRRHSGSSAT